MSEDLLHHIQETIRFCPVCGEDCIKDFELYTAFSGTWECTSCEEMIEVQLLEKVEEDDEEVTPSSRLPFILIIICLVGYIYFSSI